MLKSSKRGLKITEVNFTAFSTYIWYLKNHVINNFSIILFILIYKLS